jgi:flagellar hook assembly protein FlgD
MTSLTASPNPFIPKQGQSLRVEVGLAASAMVSLTVVDKQGRTVYHAGPVTGQQGVFAIVWDGLTDKRTPTPPGAYVLTAVAANGSQQDSHSVDLAVANQGGQLPGSVTPRGRAQGKAR